MIALRSCQEVHYPCTPSAALVAFALDLTNTNPHLESTPRGAYQSTPMNFPCSAFPCPRVIKDKAADDGARLGKEAKTSLSLDKSSHDRAKRPNIPICIRDWFADFSIPYLCSWLFSIETALRLPSITLLDVEASSEKQQWAPETAQKSATAVEVCFSMWLNMIRLAIDI